jgi:hypothetical protein
LAGVPEDENAIIDRDTPLGQYTVLRKKQTSDIHVIRDTFRNVEWVHKGDKIYGPLDDNLITAWNEFEAVRCSPPCMQDNHAKSTP